MSSFFKIKKYISYIFKSKDEYSIHSPFMFDLYTNIIDKNKKTLVSKLQEHFGNENIIVIPPCFLEYEKIYPKISDETVIIISNPYNNKECFEQSKKILSHSRALVFVDLFDNILMFYNPKLSHQSYVLK